MDKDLGSTNIQDDYLARARKARAWLTVVLNSGKKVVGRILSFDRYTLILEERGGEQMIFKHAIATISAARTFANPIRFDGAGKSKGAPSTAAPAVPDRAVIATDPGPSTGD